MINGLQNAQFCGAHHPLKSFCFVKDELRKGQQLNNLQEWVTSIRQVNLGN